MGSAKAAVLPVPVAAQPMTSRPARANGIARTWIGVGVWYPADTSAVQAMIHGHVSAYFADATPVLYYVRTTGGQFQTAGKQLAIAPEGIATRKGDPLGPQINNAIQALYLNGKMKTILAKWQASQFALKKQ